MVWFILWIISLSFNYIAENETETASTLRKNLGIKKESSGTGLGFMQLISDLVIWLSFFVYLVYVWDASGTTIDRLFELIILGGQVGNIQLVPAQLIGGILLFTLILALIGWLKRWIDRRWLQHIIIERGAREALITLFGYAPSYKRETLSIYWPFLIKVVSAVLTHSAIVKQSPLPL